MVKKIPKLNKDIFERSKKSKKELAIEQFILFQDKRVIDVPLECIVLETQMREYFENIDHLSSKIEELGQDTPIKLMEMKNKEGKFLLLCGERRYRAIKKLGKDSIKAIIKPYIESSLEREKIAQSDNLDRKQLNVIEMATGIQRLSKLGMSQKEIAIFYNKSISSISKYSMIAKLPKKEKEKYLKLNHGFSDILENLANKKVSLNEKLASKKVKKPKQLSLFSISNNKIKLSSTTFDFLKETNEILEIKINQMEEVLREAKKFLKKKRTNNLELK